MQQQTSIMPRKNTGKPRGRMSSYAFFVQTCREEHRKKYPGENVVFAEFSRKCAEKWKEMTGTEKGPFEDMAARDKMRYELEMEQSGFPKGEKRKRTKDPNAPKRALCAFIFYCSDERSKVRLMFPDYGVADVSKELAKRWSVCQDKPKYDAMAAQDKLRYAQEMALYKGNNFKRTSTVSSPAKKPKTEDAEEEEEDDDDEYEDDE